MSEPLTFRARTGPVAFAAVFGAALVYLLHVVTSLLSTRLPWEPDAAPPGNPLLAPLIVGYVVVVGVVALVACRRVTIDAEGLTKRLLFWRTQVRWDEVVGVRLPWGGSWWWPGVVLDLDRPRARFWALCRGEPWREQIFGGLVGFERLEGEIVARCPDAAVSEGVRGYLAAPHRVTPGIRIVALAPLALLAGLLVAQLSWTVTAGGFAIEWVLALLAAAWVVVVSGGALRREWPWKPVLVVAAAALAAVPAFALLPASIHAMTTVMLLALAAALGWVAAALVICLPWRPRWWQATGLYAACLAVAVSPAWWYARGEPVAYRETRVVQGAQWWMAWSPDGSKLCVPGGRRWLDGSGSCHVIDRASLAARTFETGPDTLLFWMPDPRRVLYQRGARGEDDELRTWELWALDAETGERALVLAAPRIGLADRRSLSPDGRELVFRAGPDDALRPYRLRLADLSLEELDLGTAGEDLAGIGWRPDGSLLLVRWEGDRSDEDSDRPERLSFWTVPMPSGKPVSLYQTTAPRIGWRSSPDNRWALVAAGPTLDDRDRYEVVDLLSGAARRLELPGHPDFWQIVWSPDGVAFACEFEEGQRHTIAVADAAEGKVRRAYATDDKIDLAALSAGGRYAYCRVGAQLGGYYRVIDLVTAEAKRLRGRFAFYDLASRPAWAPDKPVLAVCRPTDFGPAGLYTIRLFRFPADR